MCDHSSDIENQKLNNTSINVMRGNIYLFQKNKIHIIYTISDQLSDNKQQLNKTKESSIKEIDSIKYTMSDQLINNEHQLNKRRIKFF